MFVKTHAAVLYLQRKVFLKSPLLIKAVGLEGQYLLGSTGISSSKSLSVNDKNIAQSSESINFSNEL